MVGEKEEDNSTYREQTRGIRIGAVESPILFILTPAWALAGVDEREREKISGDEDLEQKWIEEKLRLKIREICYADDLTFLGLCEELIQTRMEALEEMGRPLGFKVERSKCKALKMKRPRGKEVLERASTGITFADGSKPEAVDQLRWLGGEVTHKEEAKTQIPITRAKVFGAYNSAKNIWKGGAFSKKKKAKIMEQCIGTVVYAYETMNLSEKEESKLDAMHNALYRKLSNVPPPAFTHARNSDTDMNMEEEEEWRWDEQAWKMKAWDENSTPSEGEGWNEENGQEEEDGWDEAQGVLV